MEEQEIKLIIKEMERYYFNCNEDENYFPESTIKTVLLKEDWKK